MLLVGGQIDHISSLFSLSLFSMFVFVNVAAIGVSALSPQQTVAHCEPGSVGGLFMLKGVVPFHVASTILVLPHS